MTNYPKFPQFKSVELEDKDFLSGWFQKYPVPLNEYSFSTLFSWRAYGGYEWSIWGNFLFVLYNSPVHPEQAAFWCPCGEGDLLKAFEIQFEYLKKNKNIKNPVIKLVTEKYLRNINLSEVSYMKAIDDTNSDYIYDTEEFINLKGRKYAKKRNLIKQFTTLYNAEFKDLTPDLIDDCLKFQEMWCKTKSCIDFPDLVYEDIAIKESLENFELFKLKGAVAFADNQIAGFTVGKVLTPDMAVIHFEKADTNFKGAYQYIAREFSKYFSNYKYINREQDMGDENLRQSKQSYFPCFKEIAYDLFPKTSSPCYNTVYKI